MAPIVKQHRTEETRKVDGYRIEAVEIPGHGKIIQPKGLFNAPQLEYLTKVTDYVSKLPEALSFGEYKTVLKFTASALGVDLHTLNNGEGSDKAVIFQEHEVAGGLTLVDQIELLKVAVNLSS